MQIVKYFKHIFLSSIIFLIPFVDFLNKNIEEIEIILGKSFYFLIFIVSSFLLILTYTINYILKKINFYEALLIVGVSYWLFFQHNFIKLTIVKIFNIIGLSRFNLSAELSLIIIIVLSVYLSKLIYKNNLFLIKFFYIFFLLTFFASIFQIIVLNKKPNLVKTEEISIINFPDKLNNKKENIYFFILDGMQPIDEFEKHYQLSKKDFIDSAQNKKYDYIHNTVNFYGNTSHSLSALFYLDKIFNEENQLKKKITKFFPSFLRNKNKNPDLIYNLNNLGYDFKWIGNFFAYCPKFNLNYCLKKDNNTIIDSYLYINFFKQTPLIQIIIKLGEIFKFDFNKYIFFKLNNGMGRLISYLKENIKEFKKNKPTFYFIHHMSPHWPYITKSDCSYKKYPGKQNLEGYKSAYLCTLKRIEEMINFLNEIDPNSIVVFQGDHNWEMSYFSEIKYGRRNEIFNLIKIDEKCNMDQNINLNNVNTARLILSCITGNNPGFLK